MPRSRTYTDAGYVEVQWSKKGRLVCLVSATVTIDPELGEVVTSNVMHQFTERGDIGVLLRDVTRARKQAFERFGGDAPIPVLDSERIVRNGKVGKVRPARVEYVK